jgi:uncharacterized protein
MKPMKKSLRGYALALAILWAILILAAILYSRDQGFPFPIVAGVLPAFLIEAALYLAAGMQATRERLEELAPPRLALLMTGAAVVPYTICTVGLGVFAWQAALLILALAAFASYFYVLLPHRPAFDLLFLACIAAVVLLKVFPRLFPAPLPKLELSALGAAMWVRTTMLAMLSIRKMDGVGFGFLPRASDWRIGLRYYLLFMPVGIALALWLGFLRVQPRPLGLRMLLLTAATFFGILWVVALSEEFFFRGVLQQTLDKLLESEVAGLVLASLVFGAVHLPFRAFPNWRFAILATLAGVAYGLAFRAARSIRAAMVAHALVVTTWRLLA